ncbi:MAG: hypothetical protein KDG50_03240 [Chromatiales bacterium]|nr:hypothetical protein [Chromatiales bacterium]
MLKQAVFTIEQIRPDARPLAKVIADIEADGLPLRRLQMFSGGDYVLRYAVPAGDFEAVSIELDKSGYAAADLAISLLPWVTIGIGLALIYWLTK